LGAPEAAREGRLHLVIRSLNDDERLTIVSENGNAPESSGVRENKRRAWRAPCALSTSVRSVWPAKGFVPRKLTALFEHEARRQKAVLTDDESLWSLWKHETKDRDQAR
jgi:hypothetical protein